MLDSENQIQDEINQAGRIETRELLKKFDTDGEALRMRSGKYGLNYLLRIKSTRKECFIIFRCSARTDIFKKSF